MIVFCNIPFVICVADIETDFMTNENLLLDYEGVIQAMEEDMTEYSEYILHKTEFYAVCQSGRRWGVVVGRGTPPRAGCGQQFIVCT